MFCLENFLPGVERRLKKNEKIPSNFGQPGVNVDWLDSLPKNNDEIEVWV